MVDLNVRNDGRIEFICEHGVGHTIRIPDGKDDSWYVHGCDSCCHKNPISDEEIIEGLKKIKRPNDSLNSIIQIYKLISREKK